MYIIDVEASGLDPESYPIQIGWTHRGDTYRCGEILIAPHPDWVYWSPDAELVHKIPRESLANGMEISEACHLLNKTFGPRPVYSDAYTADSFWLSRLFDTAGVEPDFTVRSVFSLVAEDRRYEFEKRLHRKPRPHTALEDARIICDAVNFFVPY